MTERSRATLTLSRRVLQNPYAHIEELEALDSTQPDFEPDPAMKAAIRESRKRLEDPYAYVDDDGFVASTQAYPQGRVDSSRPRNAERPLTTRVPRRSATPRLDVASEVARLHRSIWRRRGEISSEVDGTDPIQLLDPEIALSLLGFTTEHAPELGTYRRGTQVIEVAGLIENSGKRVRISLKPTPQARRFTLAHELGHAVMHPQLTGVHRDRASDGSSLSRDGNEMEADRFATLFLQPEKLVRRHFRSRFLTERFVFSEEAKVALGGEAICGAFSGLSLRAASRLLAGAGRFDGRSFCSLAEQFQVSRETMAIRIEELGLIEFNE